MTITYFMSVAKSPVTEKTALKKSYIPRAKRKSKKRKEGEEPYFGETVQKAVLDYAALTTDAERDKLYSKTIHPAFNTMSESLYEIFRIRLKAGDNKASVCSDCNAHLASKLLHYNTEKGTSSFSYFTVIARNFLFHYSNERKLGLKHYADNSKIEKDWHLKGAVRDARGGDLEGKEDTKSPHDKCEEIELNDIRLQAVEIMLSDCKKGSAEELVLLDLKNVLLGVGDVSKETNSRKSRWTRLCIKRELKAIISKLVLTSHQ